MSKAKKTDKWKVIFIVIPMILFGKISNIFDGDNLAFTVIPGIIGVLFGYLLYYLTKNKSLITKLISLSFTIIIPLGIHFFNSKNEIEKEWLQQTINTIEFSAPDKLKLSRSETPKENEEEYSKYEIYSDGNKSKLTIIQSITYKEDNIDLEHYFNQNTEIFKETFPSITALELTEQKSSPYNITARIRFIMKDKSLNGFCRLVQKGKQISLFWLVPLSKGFSKKYIDKFDRSIKA